MKDLHGARDIFLLEVKCISTNLCHLNKLASDYYFWTRLSSSFLVFVVFPSLENKQLEWGTILDLDLLHVSDYSNIDC